MKKHLQVINSMRILLSSVAFVLVLMIPSFGWSQTSVQNFGNATATHVSQTGSSAVIPNPVGVGTTYVRSGATAANAPISLVIASNPLGTSEAYVRAAASTSASVAKVSPIVSYTAGLEFYTSFKVLLGDASATNTATSGVWTFYQGLQGSNYTDNTDVSNGNVFTGLRFTFGPSGALTLTFNNAGTYNSAGLTTSSFSQGVAYNVEIVGNNKSAGTINYTYAGNNQTVAVQKFDLYINGVLVGNDLSKGGAAGNTNINAMTWTGVSSTSNAANLFLDNVAVFNAVPSSITGFAPTITGTATTAAFTTTYGQFSAAQSFTVSGTNLTANLIATAPTGFEVSNDGVTYGTTATFAQTAGNASGSLRIRLKADALVSGSYNAQNIVLSSTGASSVNITTPSSGNSVAPATLTITANNQNVAFGTPVATVVGAGTFASSGYVNSDTASVLSGTVSYTTTYTDTTPAGTLGVTILPNVSGLTAANYVFASVAGTITVTTAATPTITSALTFSAVYGTVAPTYTITASEAPTSFSAVGLPNGLSLDTTTGAITGTPSAAPGAYDVIISATNGAGTGDSQILVYTITPKELTISGAVANNKIYDRTNAATIAGSTLVGVFGSDNVTVSNTGTFATVSASTGIAVTSTQTLSGLDAAKYTLTLPSGLSADITPRALTISGALAQNKEFDGTTTATITGTLSGVIAPDVVTLSLSGTFASSAIGTGIAVTSTSTIGGAASGNYSLTQPIGLSANITQPVFPLVQWNTFNNTGNETTEPSAANDATMQASTLNYTGSTVVPAGNANRFGGSGWFATGNTAGGNTLAEAFAGNKYIQFTVQPAPGYLFTPTSLSFIWDASGTGVKSATLRSSADGYVANIGTITSLVIGTTTFNTMTLSGLSDLTTTTFRLYGYGATGTGGTGGFDTGSSQNNVRLLGYTSLAPAPVISASGTLAALTTVYGTPSAETTFSVSGTNMQAGILVTPPSGYEVSLTSGSGFASTVTVGAAGAIASTTVYVRLSATASVINSPFSGDVVLSSLNTASVLVPTASSTVTPKELTVTGVTAANKVFDGTTAATLNGTASLIGVINSDVVILGGTPVATFATADVGANIAVSVTGYTISGTGAANYFLMQPSLTADITSEPSPIITSALTASATYGVVAPTYTITASNAPTAFSASGLPAGLTVNAINGEITGTPTGLPGVYTVTISATNGGGTGTAQLSYTILAKELTLSGAVANDKIYDKLNAATISGFTVVGVVGTDAVVVSNTGTFASVNVGTALSVTSTQTLSGADAAKYVLTVPTGLTAAITPKALTVTGAVAQNKPFDGTTAANITGTLAGIIAGDVVTFNGTGTFASAAQGTAISVTSTSTLLGASAGNYSLTQPVGLVANITAPVILQWNTFGNAGTETTEPSTYNNPNVTAANLTLGSITAAGNSNRFGGTGWFNTGNTTGGNTLAEAVAGNDYIQFVVTPTSGYTFTPTSFSFIWDFSGTGPKSVALRSSADGFTNDIGTLVNMTASQTAVKTIPITSLMNVSATTTFRLYGFGASAATGTGGFDCNSSQNNVILFGTSALLTGPTASVISGSTTVCQGDSAAISIAMTGGTGPFTVQYTDGTIVYTETNFVSGTNIIVSPTATATYTIVSVVDSLGYVGTGNSGSAVVTVLPNLTYYVDADNDGFGDPLAPTFQSCVPLVGYVTLGTDCNDANAAINPNAVDVCYDGIDNDCNGVIDNVGLPGGCTPIVGSLPAGTCGTTLAGWYSTVTANWTNFAQGYRF
ncbi:YDG domain-containing protein, partial [Flavobacterium sp.]|uniref:YDG domain-containing protein n=1 Tax=Flavobacterium sp. TaxID=239 RepID=UPI002601D830